jgi:hypothetical protein
MNPRPLLVTLLTASLLPATLSGQIASNTSAPTLVPAPTSTSTSTTPHTTFHDPSYKISFDYPADWSFSKRDGEISTFHLEARSAPHTTRLRAVAAIPENPYPASTFSGAHLYLSVTPRATEASCASQAAPAAKPAISRIAGVPFAHGHDEQRHICITDRDEIYTTYRKGACYRFDLAINNFCGGEVSSVKDITQKELDDVRNRMEAILATVRFDPK